MNADDRELRESEGPPIEHAVFYNSTQKEWCVGYIDEDTGLLVVRRTAPTREQIQYLLTKEFHI